MTHTPSEPQTGNAALLVSSAALGLDFRIVMVAGRRHIIHPPTIRRIAGAAQALARVADAQTVADIITSQTDITAAARALSWFVCGSADLTEEFSEAPLDDVIEALQTAYSLVSVQPFSTLSALARSIANLTANPRQ